MFLKYEPEDFPDVENMKCERTTMRFPGSDPTQIQPDLGVWHLGEVLVFNKSFIYYITKWVSVTWLESLNFYFTQFNC